MTQQPHPADSQAHVRQYISLQALHNRHWTSRMVWQLLGLPDITRTTEPFPKMPKRQLYNPVRVEQACQGKHFQVLRLPPRRLFVDYQ